MTIPKKSKTDPTFSNERYTVLSRAGGKVVLRSERGIQYTRSVNDLKKASLLNYEGDDSTDDMLTNSEDNEELQSNANTSFTCNENAIKTDCP